MTVSRQRFSTRDMIERLVGFDTTSRNSNLDLIAFVEDYLAGYGVASRRIANEDNTKANLFATLGPADRAGGIVLSGHTDVVPVDGQDWSGDPFRIREIDGCLLGRGTSDMKSFIAASLAAVPMFLEKGLRIPVHLAFSYDEEVGCLGVRPMIDQVIRSLPRPQIVIVGEPSGMKVVNAHKGIQSYRTDITGHEFHSSQTHKGVSAIAVAADLINFLMSLADEMRERGDSSGRFQPPCTTINIGLIHGGTALNIIPGHCSFTWEYRALPDHDQDEIISRFTEYAQGSVLPQMRTISKKTNIEIHTRARSPGLTPQEGSPGETLVLQLAQCNSTAAVSYNTEAGLFQLADIPTVICGPGDIAQAHQPDEFIALSQLDECDRFMARLADHVSSA